MKAISMKCTQEQFESIKPKLIGLEDHSDRNFKTYPYLTSPKYENHWVNNHNKITMDKTRKIYETWDEKVFLKACGIEVEKTYKITKETVLKYKMKDEFPECFDVKLEVGKWMKTPNNGMYCLKEKKDDGFLCYGFNVNGKWDELFVPNSITKNDVVATTQEIQQALEKEAVKRGFKEGVLVKRTQEILTNHRSPYASLEVLIENDKFDFCLLNNSLTIDGRVIFIQGTWATIVPQYTQQEAEEKFNFKIV